MDNRAEVREFLMTRRARVTPEAAGIAGGANRRVAGLRRGEVAILAGVSVEYYAKLERGAIAGASASVLDAIARALQLDDRARIGRAVAGVLDHPHPADAREPPETGRRHPLVHDPRRMRAPDRSGSLARATHVFSVAPGSVNEV